MYKSLLLLSLFSLSACAMNPKKEAPSLSSNAISTVPAIVSAAVAFTACTPSCIVGGPASHTACTVAMYSTLAALAYGAPRAKQVKKDDLGTVVESKK